MASLTLGQLLSQQHLLLLPGGGSARQVIDALAAPLVEDRQVGASYADDVWRREQEYPTGLPTSPVPSALPHGDPDAIRESAIAVGILSSPVPFGQMGTDGTTTVQARVIVLLAIREREHQVKVIQQVAELLQNEDLLSRLAKVTSPAEAFSVLHSFVE
jgi:PTS system galactitol-specific IIA component